MESVGTIDRAVNRHVVVLVGTRSSWSLGQHGASAGAEGCGGGLAGGGTPLFLKSLGSNQSRNPRNNPMVCSDPKMERLLTAIENQTGLMPQIWGERTDSAAVEPCAWCGAVIQESRNCPNCGGPRLIGEQTPTLRRLPWRGRREWAAY